jgi:DNA invertase Pin-like site-specific DNA recombinase
MPRKTAQLAVVRNIALCYVRKSWTRDEKDTISPERQIKHIQAVCDAHGWQPEWYQDTDGHRSGMHEKNRPEWLRLKTRLGDADVVALVANDLARLHRKGWRIGDLIDFVDQHGLKLGSVDR